VCVCVCVCVRMYVCMNECVSMHACANRRVRVCVPRVVAVTCLSSWWPHQFCAPPAVDGGRCAYPHVILNTSTVCVVNFKGTKVGGGRIPTAAV
jgi:hypothetical protein